MGRKTITLIAAGVTAAIGASLVFLYVQGVDSRAQADAEPVEVLIANAPIEAGETVSDAQAAGKLELTETPGSAVLPGALTTTDTISDMVALAPIYAGEQVLAAKFGLVGSQSRISIPSETMAISLELTDPQRVAGFVSPGSTVAVFASIGTACSAGTEAVATTEPTIRLLLPEVPVIGVGQTGISATTTTAEGGEETTEQIPTTILTMALDQSDAERAMLASQTSCLSLGLLTDKSTVKATAGTTFRGLFSKK